MTRSMGKCRVCGNQTPLCIPLTFCKNCRKSRAADEIRVEHKAFMLKLIRDFKVEKGMELVFS